MSSLPDKLDAIAVDVSINDIFLKVILSDGREVSTPLAWFPILFNATEEQRNNWRFIGKGIGIHWIDLDEDISVSSLLRTS